MKKIISGFLIAIVFWAPTYCGVPLRIEFNEVIDIWVEHDQRGHYPQPFTGTLEQKAVLADYGSSQAPCSELRMNLKDALTISTDQESTSEISLFIERSMLGVTSRGRIVEYENNDVVVVAEQSIFCDQQHRVTRKVETSGQLSVIAGGVVKEPKGNLRFSLPPCDGRGLVTYDVSFTGTSSPTQFPL